MDLLATGGEGGSGSGVKNAVFFDNVRVPADHLIGGENNGWKVATTHLEVEHGGMGRLADRRVIYEFIELAASVTTATRSRTTPTRARNWSSSTSKRRSRGSSRCATTGSRIPVSRAPTKARKYSLRRKLSGLDISEKMLRIAGPCVLTKDKRWGPLKGNIEYFQRDAITALHPGATTDIQRVDHGAPDRHRRPRAGKSRYAAVTVKHRSCE